MHIRDVEVYPRKAFPTFCGIRECLKTNLGQRRENCHHTVIYEFLCMAAGCALGTDVCHCIRGLNKNQQGSSLTRFPFKYSLQLPDGLTEVSGGLH